MTAPARRVHSLPVAAQAIAEAATALNSDDAAIRAWHLTLADHLAVTVELATALGLIDTVLEWEAMAVRRRYEIVGAAIADAPWGADRGWLASEAIGQSRRFMRKATRQVDACATIIRSEMTRLKRHNSPQDLATKGTPRRFVAARELTAAFHTFAATLAESNGGSGVGYVLEAHLSIARHIDTTLTQLVGALLLERDLLDDAFEEAGSRRAGDACSALLDGRKEIRRAIRPYQFFVGNVADDCAGVGKGH